MKAPIPLKRDNSLSCLVGRSMSSQLFQSLRFNLMCGLSGCSKLFLNVRFFPQSLHLPGLTFPLAGAISQ